MRRLLAVTLLSAASLVATSDAEAQTKRECTAEKPCVLKIGTVATKGTPWASQLESLQKRFESESGGRIDVRVFYGSADGEISLARQCKDGTLEGIGVSTGAIAELVPQLGVFELPYLFENVEQADKVIDKFLAAPIEKILGDAGFQLYIFSENGFRNFATTGTRPIRTPADLAGIQMRSQESWIHEEMYRALGGNPVRIPTGEVATALANGNVGGFDNTPLFAQAASWHSFAKTWTISNHIYQPAVVVYNKAWYDSLPDDLQKLVLSNREQETRSSRKLVRAIAPALLQNLKAFNINVIELSKEERAEFAKRTRPVHDMFRKKVAGGSELLDIIYKNK